MVDTKVSIHNKWLIEVRDANTGEIKQKAKGENILLNNWWARYLSANNNTCLSWIHFGSGTDTPVATNTKLKTPVGSKSATNQIIDTDNWKTNGVIAVQKSCRLEANEYIGQSIAEVGFAYASGTTGNLVTHSLIKDMNGNPLVIEKKVDEVIDIFGTVFFKIGYSFDSGMVSFIPDGNDIGQMAGALTCSQKLYIGSGGFLHNLTAIYTPIVANMINGAATHSMGVDIGTSNLSLGFDIANKKLTLNFPDAAAGSANIVGGIGSIMINGFQIIIPCTGFAQPILTKEVVGIGDGITTDFQTKFGFVKDNGTLKLYVNDLEVSGTVDYDRGYPANDVSPYLKYLSDSKTIIRGKTGLEVILDSHPYNEFGIDSFNAGYVTIYSSDDGIEWAQAAQRTSFSTTIAIPAGHKNKRYWKLTPYTTSMTSTIVTSSAYGASKNIHLSVAPAVGDTVAITYQPDVIAKDESHTLKNISIAFSFNEYTP